MIRLFQVPKEMKKENIYAFTFAEGGAMGTPGRIYIIAKCNGSVDVYYMDTLYNPKLYKKVMKILPDIDTFFESEKLDEHWNWVYMGAGNHLLMIYFPYV